MTARQSRLPPTSQEDVLEAVRRAFGADVARDAWRFLDDVAVMPPLSVGGTRIVKTDMSVEGVDFDAALYPVAYAGFRSLAQNLSDIVAKGAVPAGFVWSLAIPRSWTLQEIEQFFRGAAILAKLKRIPLFGGDLSSTSGPFVCSITIFGDAAGPSFPLRRLDAKIGDDVFVAGPLGASAAGLRLLRGRAKRARGAHLTRAAFTRWLHALPDEDAACVRAHISPFPCDGTHLIGVAHAAMDISDGLALDAHRLASASGVRVELDDVAVARAVAAGATREDALHGGEDFTILFTAPPSARVEQRPALRIGRIVAGEGVRLGGRPLEPRGYDHFST